MHVLGNSRYFWHESHSVQFSSISASIVVACWGYSWINTLKLKKNNRCIVFFLRPSLFCYSTLSFCAQPSVCQNPAAFSLLSSVPLHPHLGQAFVRKRSFAPMLLPKVWGVCRAGQPHCDSTVTSDIHPLISSPEPPKPHPSVVIDARRRFPKLNRGGLQRRGPRPPRSLAWNQMNSRNGKISRFSMCFVMCGTNI